MGKFYLLLYFILGLSSLSCTRDTDEREVKLVPAAVDLYVFGNDNDWITYWKNGEKKLLPNSGDYSTEFMGIDGKDIYAAGLFSLIQSNGFREYSYWINDTKKNLNSFLGIPINQSFFLTDFFVKDGNIYSGGFLLNASAPVDERYEYCYWKNNIKTSLFKCKYASSGLRMLLSGTDIYAAADDGLNFGYFKNGAFYPLLNKRAKYFFEHNGEVYYTGYESSNFSFFYSHPDGSGKVNLPNPNFEIFSKEGNLYLQDAHMLYKNSPDHPVLNLDSESGTIRKIDIQNGNMYGIFIFDSAYEQQRVLINQVKFMGSNSVQNFQYITAVSK